MANYATLISAIQSVITENGNNEITGPILQQALISIINSLGLGYQFIGVATPETIPATMDQRVFYIAGPGTYPNFGPLVIDGSRIGIMYYDSGWHVSALEFPLSDNSVTTEKLASGSVTYEKLSQSLKEEIEHPVEIEDSGNDSDLEITDENGNILARFSGGNFQVKNFDSRMLNAVIKKAVFMGDSITQGVYSYWNNNIHSDANRYNGFDISNPASVTETNQYHGIPYFFNLLARVETFTNLAKRGSGYVVDGRNLGNAKAVADSFSFTNTDFVALCFGVNDYIQGATIGDLTTKTIGTVIGNMCYVVEKILTDNPLCKVIAFSPYNTWGQVSNGGDYVSNVLYGSENTNYALGAAPTGKTNTLQEYIDAIDTVCQYYGIQHVALSKSNVINRVTIKNILIDGLHPSKESYIKLAAEIYGKSNYGV